MRLCRTARIRGSDRCGRVRVGWRAGGSSPNPTARPDWKRCAGTTVVNSWMPAHPANTAAGLTHYITFGELPARPIQSPAVAERRSIDDQCDAAPIMMRASRRGKGEMAAERRLPAEDGRKVPVDV